MADIFQEVEEDLRRDNLVKLWRRFGPYVIGAAVVIVVATAANYGWQRYQAAREAERARQYAAAIDMLGQSDHSPALKELGALAEGDDGFATLARLQQAALEKGGDAAAAIAIYDKMASDRGLDEPYRDLGVILLAAGSLDSGDPAALIERLAPLTADDNAFRYSALEMTALLAQRKGESARAREIFTRLSDDLNAPPGVRERATELLATLPG